MELQRLRLIPEPLCDICSFPMAIGSNVCHIRTFRGHGQEWPTKGLCLPLGKDVMVSVTLGGAMGAGRKGSHHRECSSRVVSLTYSAYVTHKLRNSVSEIRYMESSPRSLVNEISEYRCCPCMVFEGHLAQDLKC